MTTYRIWIAGNGENPKVHLVEDAIHYQVSHTSLAGVWEKWNRVSRKWRHNLDMIPYARKTATAKRLLAGHPVLIGYAWKYLDSGKVEAHDIWAQGFDW